jgi:hypothetical protein
MHDGDDADVVFFDPVENPERETVRQETVSLWKKYFITKTGR